MNLGHRSELRKPELRAIFPIIQRLLWTKWAAWQIFFNALERASPTWFIYLNIARPSKVHRCFLHLLFDSVMLMMATAMAFDGMETWNENVQAEARTVTQLFNELFTEKLDHLPFYLAFWAVIVGRCVQEVVKRIFFGYDVSMHRLVTTKPGQLETMMYWHELAEMGKWICIIGTVFSASATVAFCALRPQPRAAVCIRGFLIAVLWSHIVLPLLSALMTTIVLCQARNSRIFDGLLTVFPGIMDFLCVGVEHTDFLRWRVERIVTELEQMRMVYRAEFQKDLVTDRLDRPPNTPGQVPTNGEFGDDPYANLPVEDAMPGAAAMMLQDGRAPDGRYGDGEGGGNRLQER
jgi:hypothetical protein